MVRAWIAGILVLIVVHILLWGAVAPTAFSEVLHKLLLAGPPAAALVTAYLSPRRQFLMGMSLAPCGAAIGYAAQAMYASLGYQVDRLGTDAVSSLGVLMLFHLIYALIGSLAGILLRRVVARARQTPTSTTP